MWNCEAYHLAFGEWLKEKLREKGVTYAEFARDIFESSKEPSDALKARCRARNTVRWGLNEICRIANHPIFQEHPSYLLAQVELYYKTNRQELEKKLPPGRSGKDGSTKSTATAIR